ncbi:hypothetical protein R1sor_002962 [Riccia sorocarpa]|uniref:Cytochrome P450 n=1 Tax=Riccia sorocarpa TaxID=122646 RepID=A0ABD3H3N7_9MARC
MEAVQLLPWYYIAGSMALYVCVHRWILQASYRGPKGWPIMGIFNEVFWIFRSGRIYEWGEEKMRLYYPTFRMKLFHTSYIVTVDPVNVEHVLKTNFSNYWKGETERTRFFDLLGYGILNSDGELWRRHRKVGSHEFASKILRYYSTQTFQTHALCICGILEQASINKKPVNVVDLMIRLTFEASCKLVFGLDMGFLNLSLPEAPFRKNFDAVSGGIGDRFLDPFWELKRMLGIGSERKLKEDIQRVNIYVDKLFQDRKADIQSNKHQKKRDLLSRYIDAVEKQPITANPSKDIKDSVINFLLAGRDSSSVGLSWLIYSISSCPRAEKKIVEELRQMEAEKRATNWEETNSAAGAEGLDSDALDQFPEGEIKDFVKLLDYDTVCNKLPYLRAAVHESLRLYPPVPVNYREVRNDDVLPACGTKVKAGDTLLWSPYVQARSEQVWGKDCSEYKPERWLKDGVFQPETNFYKFNTFNAGPRLCLGKESVVLQATITIAAIYRFFTLAQVPGEKVRYEFGVTFQMPVDTFHANVQRRPDIASDY